MQPQTQSTSAQEKLFRELNYLSPTSVRLYYTDAEKFYKTYLSKNRTPRPPQTVEMALGSAFDARIKAHLYKKLINKGDQRFDLDTLYEAQVEPQNRDKVANTSKHVFDFYFKNGLSDLLRDMAGSLTEPRFEIEVKGQVQRNLHQVPILGRPDVVYTNREGCLVIVDWKVNGYYSKYDYSPEKGYINRYPDMKVHKSTIPHKYKGMMIGTLPMEEIKQEWADQLSMYSWLLGGYVGKEIITAIDQIVGKPEKIKVALFRAKVSQDYQVSLFEKVRNLWEYIQEEHIFRDISKEESIQRCKLLDDNGGPELF